MGLAQDIVVVNEFTVDASQGGVDGYGRTPGAYVTRYTARASAVEPISPTVRNDLDSFITKYTARASAVEQLVSGYQVGAQTPSVTKATHGYDAPTLAGRRKQRSLARARKRASALVNKVRSLLSGGRSTEDEVDAAVAQATAATAELGEPAGVDDLKAAFIAAQGDGGVAFGHHGVSLSHDQLHADSARIQQMYEDKRVVHKTVLSFSHEYLVSQGVVPADMSLDVDGRAFRGDYRGKLDQLKLRLAVMEGLAAMARQCGFGAMEYVGVIQVDTRQVHAHLTIVDTGTATSPQRYTAAGAQKGKFSAAEKATLRRGVDSYLQRARGVEFMASSVGFQRRSVSAYVKKWAYESLSVSSSAQFVLSCLPADRRRWRAGTQARDMARPNALVRELVLDHLSRPGSPMPTAMAKVTAYAVGRREREDLSEQDYERLITAGREKIITQAMNGVYSVLASVADDELVVSTPLLSVMSSDVADLREDVVTGAQETNTGAFALRLRAYTERLDRHRSAREHFTRELAGWNTARERGLATPESAVMARFFDSEAQYHWQLMSKYQYQLETTAVDTAGWSQEWAEVDRYGRKLVGLRSLRADKGIAKMADPSAAEELGRSIYGQHGGSLLAATGAEGKLGRDIIDNRIAQMSTRYDRLVNELLDHWRELGPAVRLRAVTPGETPAPGEYVIAAGDDKVFTGAASLTAPGVALMATSAPEHEFSHVKGLDMHELGWDWEADQSVGPKTQRRFNAMLAARAQAIEDARVWLLATGQDAEVASILGDAMTDVAAMAATSAAIEQSGVLPSEIERRRQEKARAAAAAVVLPVHERAPKRVGMTTRLDTGLGGAVHASVDEVVRGWLPGE